MDRVVEDPEILAQRVGIQLGTGGYGHLCIVAAAPFATGPENGNRPEGRLPAQHAPGVGAPAQLDEHLPEHLDVLCRERLGLEDLQLGDLPEGIRCHAELSPSAGRAESMLRASPQTLAQTKENAEAARITAALARNGNNRLRAAAELGISRMTLYKKLHKFGLIAR